MPWHTTPAVQLQRPAAICGLVGISKRVDLRDPPPLHMSPKSREYSPGAGLTAVPRQCGTYDIADTDEDSTPKDHHRMRVIMHVKKIHDGIEFGWARVVTEVRSEGCQ